MMKWIALFFWMCLCTDVDAQVTPLPHGMIFGQKPDTGMALHASKIEAVMGKKPRVSTTVIGKVIDVKKEKGGWFELDAGAGKIIMAHFTNYNVRLPKEIKGRTVIVQGIAVKPFTPGNRLPLSGDTAAVKGGNIKRNRAVLDFEVTGLMVYQ
jgi:hypothetical protein